jgi:PAS domain S-box-containing protein
VSKLSSSPSRPRSAGSRYGAAVLAVAAALAVKLGLDRVVDTGAPFLLFPLAILAAAWWGGLRPGLLATLLSAAAAIPMFLLPPSAPGLGPGAIALRTTLFLLQGIGISLIAHAFEQARRQADDGAARAAAAVGELEEANLRASAILDSIKDTFFSVDRDWRFTYVNRQLRHVPEGEPPREMIGRVLWDVFPELLGTLYEDQYRRAMSTGAPAHFEGKGTLSGRWFEVHVYPSRHGLSVFAMDQSERKKLEEALRAAKADAEAANRMKDQFLAILSHELRTPLNAIFGWAQLLRTGNLDPQAVERGIDTIDRNARVQKKLIEDLLDISRIISGKLQIEKELVDLAEVIDTALETVAPAARARSIAIERGYDSRPALVSGDMHRLQQVVWNLLSNAVKFTADGGVVSVTLETRDGEAEIAITDTGQGIGPELLPFVFDRFRQGDASATRRHGGLGLGLSIVRQLAELHGGTVRAESDGEGHGSRFIVSLPLAIAPELPEERRSPLEGDGDGAVSLAGLRVLVVDDEADARELLEHVLSGCQAEVALAASAAEALEAIDRFRPDVLVSDIGMPGEDGYELIRKARERGFRGPAAALTAFARAEDRRRALLAGFQIHLAKPVHPGELAAVVASLADRARSTE